MSNLIQYIENKYINHNIPLFRTGDIIQVQIWIIESSKKRIQFFQGVVISKRNRGVNSSFTVRKISYGEGVERVFQTYASNIHKIIVKKKNLFKKSKLYYLRKNIKKFIHIK